MWIIAETSLLNHLPLSSFQLVFHHVTQMILLINVQLCPCHSLKCFQWFPLRQCSFKETPRLLEPFLAASPWILFPSHLKMQILKKPPLSKPWDLAQVFPCLECPLSLSVFETLIICHTLSFVNLPGSLMNWAILLFPRGDQTVSCFILLISVAASSQCLLYGDLVGVPVKQMNERMNDKLIGPANRSKILWQSKNSGC